jgi:hypothetical protein
LALITCLRDTAWARGYNWGFEAFRTLVRCRYNFDLDTVEPNFLPVSLEASEELAALGSGLLPDVLVNNPHGDYPQDVEVPLPPPALKESSEDEATLGP